MSDVFTHRIEVYTSSLVFSGCYDLTIYRRVSVALNGEQRRYIPLRDATIAPLERPTQIQRVPQLLFDRNAALLVMSIEEAPPPADYPQEQLMQPTELVGAMLFTSAFALRAQLPKRPNWSLQEILDRFTDDFVSLRNVQVFMLHAGQAPLNRSFAALNRAAIIALYLLNEPAVPTPEPGAG